MSGDPQYDSVESINYVIRRIQTEMKMKLSPGQMSFVASHIRKLDKTLFRGFIPEVVYKQLTMFFIRAFQKQGKPSISQTDVMDVLRSDIGTTGEDGAVNVGVLDGEAAPAKRFMPTGIEQILGETTTDGIQKFFNPKARERKVYIFLDSKNRTVSDSVMNFKWNVVNNITPGAGSINMLGAVRDIVGIRVKQVRIPYVRAADTALKRITMSIDEFSSQSVRAAFNYFYHFLFVSSVDGDWIDLKIPEYNESRFEFAKPITQLNTLTIGFGNPVENIEFDIDRSQSTIVTLGSPTIIQTLVPHNLQSGNYVSFSNFTTLNPTTDTKVIEAFNRTSGGGYPVIVISPVQFSVPIDTSSLQTVLSGTSSINTGTTALAGVGTAYLTEVKVGDTLRLTDGVNFYYPVVASITDNFNLNFVAYTGPTIAAGIVYRVSYTNAQFLTYFESKRVIAEFELTYISPDVFSR